jgi:hypothetical protein
MSDKDAKLMRDTQEKCISLLEGGAVSQKQGFIILASMLSVVQKGYVHFLGYDGAAEMFYRVADTLATMKMIDQNKQEKDSQS